MESSATERADAEFGVHPASKIGILVVAYNAATTLASVLDRVPEDFRARVSQVFVCDDASDDSTYLVGLGYQQVTKDMPLSIIRHPSNLGYGGNQKAGYLMAIEEDLDIIVMLHGDGQYAPEVIADVVAPLERGEADAVFGSRMMEKGAARKGGMPLYKYVGNRILTQVENRMLGTELSEFHSGYRAYSVKALKSIPFERNSDGFNFDTQIIIQLVDAGKRIREVSIPTYYGDEICYVDGLKYAKDVLADVTRYRLGRLGFDAGAIGHVGETYAMKSGEESSHNVIQRWLAQMPSSRILDLGCSGGLLSERARELGHHVVAVDLFEPEGIRSRVDTFVQADLNQGVPEAVATPGGYDIVLCADILEHLTAPQDLLREIAPLLSPHGMLMVSVPNISHWYSRIRIGLGLFDYDQRGILDQTHMRFFTRRSLRRHLRGAGFEIVRQEATGLPVEVLIRNEGTVARVLRRLDRLAVSARPTLFGYQFVVQCARPTEPSVAPAPVDA
jgi:2-polyprenyl-3-methyl-5-hydroxy-6-metoxy-1,4-benzoquinol methylase